MDILMQILKVQFPYFYIEFCNYYHTCMSTIRLIFFLDSGSFSMSPKADASRTVLKALRKLAAWQGNPRDVSSM